MHSDIHGQLTIPELLQRYPHLRAVLDRYGLAGCGGPWGPPETLEFFARAHGVDAAQLLAELKEAASKPELAPLPVAPPTLADRLYKRFFFAGILAVVTVGAGWGAYLLWQIAKNASFTATSIFAVNAHGQGQIYGWVGLFIFGFAYHAFPRFLQTRLQWAPLAAGSFLLLVTGILLRSLFEPQGKPLAVAGALLQLIAVLAFVAVVFRTFATTESSRLLPFLYIRAASLWFLAATAFDAWHVARLVSAGSREQVLAQVATYQAALRDMQIHGVAMLMIFGVAVRLFPTVFSFSEPNQRWFRALFWPLNLGVASESLAFVFFMQTRKPLWAGLAGLGAVLVALGALGLAASLRLFAPAATYDRSHKFFRASHLWLAVAMVMLLAAPFYFKLSGHGFSHAWYGAARHAITVGFVTLTIMGVAARIIPTLAGLDANSLGKLAVPFALVNTGCFLRVAGQVATDFNPDAFVVTGLSGLLEVTGLTLWGLPLAAILLGLRQPGALPRLSRLDPDAPVAAILASFPQAREALLALGFSQLQQPFFLRTVARTISLRQACALRGQDLQAVLSALEQKLRQA